MTTLGMPPIAISEGLSLWVTALSIGTMVVFIVHFQLLQFALYLIRETVWIPWTVARHMRNQGYSGPSLGPFKDNAREMQELTIRAAVEPFHTSSGLSHDFMPRVLAPIHTWRHLYGDKFIFKQGSRVTLHTSNADAIKEVFSNKFHEFGKLTDRKLSSDLVGSQGLAFAEQEEWARQRRVVHPAFYPARSTKFVVQMASWIEIWLQRLDSLVVDQGGAVDIEMIPELDDLTKDILARYLFGSSFAKGRECFQHQENQKNLLLEQGFGSLPYRWIPAVLQNEISKEKEAVLRCYREVIQRRRKSIEPGNYESYGDDFLGLILADRDRHLAIDGRLQGDIVSTEDEHIIDQCRAFCFAGSDTILTALSWATVLLGHYTDWQERIRAEIQEACPGGSSPDGDTLIKLKQLDMFVEESLRLYSPASAVYREVVKSKSTLRGEPLSKHLVIMIDILGVHREKQYWGEDALEFKPERFANGIANACSNRFAFNPFGGGPRNCIAQAFALTELKLILAMLVQRFSFRLSPSYRHEPVFSMNLQPRFGVQVVLERVSSIQQKRN